MDRNNRYTRRGACCDRYTGNTNYAGSGGYRKEPTRQANAPVGNANCLCDSQPVSLAMAYVKDQPFEGLYSPAEGLRYGTIFDGMNKPYCDGGGRR